MTGVLPQAIKAFSGPKDSRGPLPIAEFLGQKRKENSLWGIEFPADKGFRFCRMWVDKNYSLSLKVLLGSGILFLPQIADTGADARV
jgi:hypothetical protein